MLELEKNNNIDYRDNKNLIFRLNRVIGQLEGLKKEFLLIDFCISSYYHQ